MLTTGPKYYVEQQRLSALAVRQLRRPGGLTEMLRLLAIYQATAALLAMENGVAALDEQGLSSDGAMLVPTAFTVAPDAPSVLDDIQPGRRFDRIVGTLVSDAGRSAMGAFTASRSEEYGHVRVLVPPTCSRCAVLAGSWYRWSSGFDRHPTCDCEMLPAPRSAALYDPYAAYERGEIGSYRTMPDGTRKFESGLSRAQRKAIDDGADIGQVINATSGLRTVNFAGRRIQVTTAGTTSRGLAYRSLIQRGGATRVEAGFVTRITTRGRETRRATQVVARAPRLSPESIYRVAEGNRETAIRLLRANGYIL